jgi:hypothetical protein
MRLSLPETQTYILHKYRQVLTDSQTRRTIRALMFRCVDFPWTSRNREMAEGEGFEPPLPVRVKRFSRPPVSTTHTSLREWQVHSDDSDTATQSKGSSHSGTDPASWIDTFLRPPYYLARSLRGSFFYIGLGLSRLAFSCFRFTFQLEVS